MNRTHILLYIFLSTSLQAQIKNVQINQPNGRPEEVSIAINPKNPNNLIAGANIRSFYYSTDGGSTWSEGQLTPNTYGDPCVIFDGNGRCYYASLSSSFESILVRRSDDGGKTWSQPVQVRGPHSDSARSGSLYNSSLQDKEWMAADITSSPHAGNIYVSWTDFTKYGSKLAKDSSVIVFARSTNRGVAFEPYVRVSDTGGDAVDGDNTMEGAVPAVGPNGEVYLAWAGPAGLYFDASFDGGKTFGKDKILSTTPGGWAFEISGIMRCNGLPITACDISTSNYRGTIYVNWVDFRNGDSDVFVMKSTDKGATWSAQKRVNDDPVKNGRAQFFTWMAVDPGTGELSIVFYDRRRYVGDSTDVFLARSTDGGETFTNSRISDAAFYPTASVFFGDYSCIASLNGRIRPIWTELTGGVLSIHTALIDPLPNLVRPRSDAAAMVGQSYPNPVRVTNGRNSPASVRIPLMLERSENIRFDVIDIFGRVVAIPIEGFRASGQHEAEVNVAGFAPGLHFYRLHSSSGITCRVMLCLP